MEKKYDDRKAARPWRGLFGIVGALLCGVASCAPPSTSLGDGSIEVSIEPGPGWLHKYSALVTNPPQFAIWIEDSDGAYVKTLYATRKIATEGWVFNKGNRRKEALPYWCHRRGVRYPDGLYLPTKALPMTDAVTGASPKGGFELFFEPPEGMRRFSVYLELNHSVDFNDAFPRDAAEGSAGWSGGSEGSGQPALVYRTDVDLDASAIASPFVLSGRSSPDGSDGGLYADASGIDTALEILGGMEVRAR